MKSMTANRMIFKLFFVAFFITSHISLDAMEQSYALVQSIFDQMKHQFEKGGESALPAEITNFIYHIYFLIKINPLVDDIAQNCSSVDHIDQKDRPTLKFVNAVQRVRNVCGPKLSADIVKMGLERAKISLHDIMDLDKSNALHRAIFEGDAKVVEFLLSFVNKFDADRGWIFIRHANMYLQTTLHIAAMQTTSKEAERAEIAEKLATILLNFIDITFGRNNAHEFVTIQNDNGAPAWCFGNKQIRQIMEKYRKKPNSKDHRQ